MIRMQRSSAPPLSKLNIFLYFAWIHVQLQWNPRFSSWSLKACFFRGPEIEFLWNCGIFFKETVSFDDIEQSKDEENIVTYVDYVCGFNFYSEAPTEVDHINPERKIISRSCGKPNCFLTNDPKHQLFYRRRAYHYNLSEPIHPYTIWHKEEAALMTLNSLLIGTLRPTSILKQQLTNLEETLIRSSLQCDRWAVTGENPRQLWLLSKKLPIGPTSERDSCYRWRGRVERSLESRSKGCVSTVCDEL